MPAGVFCALLASASSIFKSAGPDTAHLLRCCAQINPQRIRTSKDGRGINQERWGCLKSWLLFRHPREFKIKSLYSNDLILNIASKSKETVQKLKFLDSPSLLKSVHGSTLFNRPAVNLCSRLVSIPSLFKSAGPDTAHLLCLNFSAGVNAKCLMRLPRQILTALLVKL